MKLTLDRTDYADTATVGKLYVDGVYECFSLEDEIEVNGIKRDGQTCIPPGLYRVVLTWSPKFKRTLPLVLDVPGFDGIRIHPGNDSGDTRGCILVGKSLTINHGAPYLLDSADAFRELYPKLYYANALGDEISLEVLA